MHSTFFAIRRETFLEQEQTGQSKLFSSNRSLTGGSGFRGLGNVFGSPRNLRPDVSAQAASWEGMQMLMAMDTQEQPSHPGPAQPPRSAAACGQGWGRDGAGMMGPG